jgi:hypothetical protein
VKDRYKWPFTYFTYEARVAFSAEPLTARGAFFPQEDRVKQRWLFKRGGIGSGLG